MNRINWVDWAKFIAITLVVFGHLPQAKDSFPVHYICTFHIPLFFFLSGFLTKERTQGFTQQLRKYWHTLIVPYLAYNLIFMPYWLVRYSIETADKHLPLDLLKPLLGVLMLQSETPISTSLNGVTWFIVALLAFRILLDLCCRSRFFHPLFVILSAGCIYLFLFHRSGYAQYENLTLNGFIYNLPFFYMGFLAQHFHAFPQQPASDKALAVFLVSAAMSVGCYYGLPYPLSIYPVSIFGIIATLSLCMSLNAVRSTFVTRLSQGTIALMGLHWMIIGGINHILKMCMGLSSTIQYPWYIALPMAVGIVLLLYPVIVLFSKKAPWMLGKRQVSPYRQTAQSTSA